LQWWQTINNSYRILSVSKGFPQEQLIGAESSKILKGNNLPISINALGNIFWQEKEILNFKEDQLMFKSGFPHNSPINKWFGINVAHLKKSNSMRFVRCTKEFTLPHQAHSSRNKN
jgi:hypothetical protein